MTVRIDMRAGHEVRPLQHAAARRLPFGDQGQCRRGEACGMRQERATEEYVEIARGEAGSFSFSSRFAG